MAYWTYDYETEDEDGNPEQWRFYYRRLNTRQMIEFEQIILDDDISSVDQLIKVAEMCSRKTERNGSPYDAEYMDWPFPVLDKMVSEHNTFRDIRARAVAAPEG